MAETTGMTNEAMIEWLWSLFDKRQFDECRDFFADDFVAEWPQSGERFVGSDNYLGMNKDYPGEYRMDVARIISMGDVVVSEVEINHDGKALFAVSIWEIAEQKIQKVTEYWAQCYEPPKWRERWVEKAGE